MSENVYKTLSAININKHVETKNKFSYLSWAWAWGTLLENYPKSTYEIYESSEERNYFHDGRTAWVKTGVIVEGVEMIEFLPVMDFRNASIPVDKLTSMDVNKAIQRSLTKAVARHGLGLYLYAGEDLPEADKPENQPPIDYVATLKTKCEKSDLTFEQIKDWASTKKDPKNIEVQANAKIVLAKWDDLTPVINAYLIEKA